MPKSKSLTPVADSHEEVTADHLERMGVKDAKKKAKAHVQAKTRTDESLDISRVARVKRELDRRKVLEKNKSKLAESDAPTNQAPTSPDAGPVQYAPDKLFNDRRKTLLKRFKNMWVNWNPLDSKEK